MYNYQDEPSTLVVQILKFLKDHEEDGLQKRELYFYPDETLSLIPKGKVVRVTIDLVSQAKLENKAE